MSRPVTKPMVEIGGRPILWHIAWPLEVTQMSKRDSELPMLDAMGMTPVSPNR